MRLAATYLVVALLSLVCFSDVKAQEQGWYINGGDTVRYTYTPLAQPVDTVVKRPGFLKRVINYFGESATDKTFEKKIDITFAGGPSYSKNTSLGLGVLAAGLYRLDRTDSVTPPSDISIFGSISLTGVYSVGIEGHNIFRHNRQKVDYLVKFSSTPRDIWGKGFIDGRDNEKGECTEKRYVVHGRYLHRVLPDTYVGGVLDFQYTAAHKINRTGLPYFYDERLKYTATGIGAVVEYDSRDFIPNPWRGIYAAAEATIYPKGLGDCGKTLWRMSLTADFYQRLWPSGILAVDLYGEYNTQGTPWPMLARMGGSRRMRGYYEGRYTDNGMITAQVELRQKIWRRIGCTLWGGAGNVFPEFSRINLRHTLPNYGVGLRWELKKRVNVRIDYGFGKNTSGFLLNINEAF